MSRQASLLWIWLIGFIASFIAVVSLWPLGDERLNNIPSDIEAISAIYSPYLLPIFSFWFAKHAPPEKPQSSSTAFWIAAVGSLFFNAIILLFIASIHFQSPGVDVVQNTLALTPKIAAGLSILTAPPIGFFFGKST